MRNITSMLTNNGQEMLSNLNGKTLTFTRAVVGQGRSQFPLEWSTKVDKYLKDIIIMSSKTVENRFVLYLKLNNRDVLYDTYVYQIGIYARLGNGTEKLVQIVEGEIGDFIPNQTEIFEKEYEVTIKFENSFADATINIIHEFDASLLDNHNKDENAHPQLKEWVKEQIEKIDVGEVSLNWYNIQNKPSTFPPSSHRHDIDDIYGLENALDNLEDRIKIEIENIKNNIKDNDIIKTNGKANEFLNGQGVYIEFEGITTDEIDILFENIPIIRNANLLINGDFQIWQRGDTITTTKTGQYVADCWKCQYSKSTVSKGTNLTILNEYTGNTMIIKNNNSAKLNLTISQKMENFNDILGKTVTLSFYIRGINGYNGEVLYGVGTGNEGTVNVTNEWQKVIWTNTIAIDERTNNVYIYSTSSPILQNQGVEIAGAKLELGSVATLFKHKDYMKEFVDCQRFCETGVCQGTIDETVLQNQKALAVVEYSAEKLDSYKFVKIYGTDSSGNKQEGYINDLAGNLYECYEISTDNGFEIYVYDVRQLTLNMNWKCTWIVECKLD